MIFKIIWIMFLVAANGFFVAAEFALVKIRMAEIRLLSRAGNRRAGMVERIMERLDAYLSGCQLGITLASLALGWVGEPLVASSLEPWVVRAGLPSSSTHLIAIPIAFVMITFLHITLGEQVPKMIAIKKYQSTALFCAIPLAGFYKVFKPFIWVVNSASNVMLKAIGIVGVDEHDAVPTEAELRLLLMESAAGGHVTRSERLFIENILDLEDKRARSYMLPRDEIVFLDTHDPVEVSLQKAVDSGHSRLPLCRNGLREVLGIVHIKDALQRLVSSEKLASLSDLAREAFFLPETISLDVALNEMRKKKHPLTLLVDEHGVVSGMITLENVLEQIVGQIQDEFDQEDPLIIKMNDRSYEVDASCPVAEAARVIGFDSTEIQTDTIGGYVMEQLGHIPVVGEKLDLESHHITVLDAEQRKVTRVLFESKR